MRPIEDIAKFILDNLMEELSKQIAVTLKNDSQIEVRVGKEAIRFSIPEAPTFVHDQAPPIVDVMKVISAKVPGLWGYCAAENGGEDWRCTQCGKEFYAKRVFYPKESSNGN